MKYSLLQRISWLMPKKFLYWCVIRAWAIATTEKYTNRTPDSLKWDEVLDVLSE